MSTMKIQWLEYSSGVNIIARMPTKNNVLFVYFFFLFFYAQSIAQKGYVLSVECRVLETRTTKVQNNKFRPFNSTTANR